MIDHLKGAVLITAFIGVLIIFVMWVSLWESRGHACRYLDGQGMIGTTLIAFAGEPLISFELTAR